MAKKLLKTLGVNFDNKDIIRDADKVGSTWGQRTGLMLNMGLSYKQTYGLSKADASKLVKQYHDNPPKKNMKFGK